MAKVMVGMSGGVDSSVAAKLLIDSGYDVTGVTLKLLTEAIYRRISEPAVRFPTSRTQEAFAIGLA